MVLLRKKSVKIDIKIVQNQIFKDFKQDFLKISRKAIQKEYYGIG